MSDIIIQNSEKKVLVLKAIGMPTLRLFPGMNTVPEEGFQKYFSNKAAKSMQGTVLHFVKKELTPEEKAEAEKAKKKNAELNKAQRIIQAQNETLAQNDTVISDQMKIIEKQTASIEEQAAEIAELKAKLEAATSGSKSSKK